MWKTDSKGQCGIDERDKKQSESKYSLTGELTAFGESGREDIHSKDFSLRSWKENFAICRDINKFEERAGSLG